ncbi:hypothetical protein [Promicromonospora soli]|uniref:EF-hand domain-containing protein n=1 Tax=Promicromonospora soli TaxID=2035533 RepID=A0A919FHY2_9MICO|nr:hypothetical protein [Promicromonospora soli]GHH65562.1 hypothetical protein GCM10017772_03980 [Promicromonospora soli]
MNRTRTLTAVATAVLAAGAVLLPAAAAQAGVSGAAFYVDGVAYRTVATPNDLSGTGAPAHSFDVIYDLGGHQLNVAQAAPGDTDYNGGRWMVHAVSFPSGYDDALAAGDLDGDDVLGSAEEVAAAIGAGFAVDAGVVASFTCPVIPLSRA